MFILLLQLLVLSQVERVLDEVDWLIARKKSQTTSDISSSGKKTLFKKTNKKKKNEKNKKTLSQRCSVKFMVSTNRGSYASLPVDVNKKFMIFCS